MPELAWLQTHVDAKLIRFYVIPPMGWIGCEHDSFVRLAGPGVTPRHCKIWRDPDGYHLRNLAGGHRTLINGKPVHEALLCAGDEIRIGPIRLLFRQIEKAVPGKEASSARGQSSASESAGLVGGRGL